MQDQPTLFPILPDPSGAKPPWNRITALLRAFQQSPWDDRDKDRLQSIVDRWDYRIDELSPGLADEIGRTIREYERIDRAQPLPTTARLARQFRAGAFEARATNLLAKAQERIRRREDELAPALKPRKTRKAQCNERRRVYGGDIRLNRLVRRFRQIEKIAEHHGLSRQSLYSRYCRSA